jgi:hypothetical protein
MLASDSGVSGRSSWLGVPLARIGLNKFTDAFFVELLDYEVADALLKGEIGGT